MTHFSGILGRSLLWIAVGLALASGGRAAQADGIAAPAPAVADGAAEPRRGAILDVTGVRITQGDAVDCPRIRDSAGRIFGVSHLPPDIAIGDRVAVRGRYAVVTTCLGEVIQVERVQRR
jgi:hypothetical protein